MSKKGIRITIIVILLLVIAGAGAYYFLRPVTKLPAPIKIDTTNQPTMGNKNARVHIVAFEDLKCGNCMRFNVTLLPKIKKLYVDTGKAKYTVINVAFITGSLPAANAARCIYHQNPKLFFQFVKYVYSNQPSEVKDWANMPTLLEFASHIKGVDQKKLGQCLLQSPYNSFVQNNLKIAAKAMGETVSTPTVYVNGVLVQPLTLKRFKQVINAVD